MTDKPKKEAYEFELVKSPMAAKAEPVASVETSAQPAATGFDHISNIPKLFCAEHDVAKGLLVDLFAMVGTLNSLENNTVDKETLPLVLQNSQTILTNLTDVLIRDCGITDSDLTDVTNFFIKVSEESMKQVSQERAGEQKPDPVQKPVASQPTKSTPAEPPKKEGKITNIL